MSLRSKNPEAAEVSWSRGAAYSGPNVVDWVRGAWALLLAWRARAAQRRALAELDDRFLRDIGLTRGDVQREVGKPFWRA